MREDDLMRGPWAAHAVASRTVPFRLDRSGVTRAEGDSDMFTGLIEGVGRLMSTEARGGDARNRVVADHERNAADQNQDERHAHAAQ